MYKIRRDGYVVESETGAVFSADAENGVAIAYRRWLSEGNTPDVEPEPVIDLWADVRAERNRLLKESDWTVLPDSPLLPDEVDAWKIYRQELRDLPQVFDSLEDVVWPEKP